MEYYENKKNVENYIKFTPSHDGSLLIDKMLEFVDRGARVLEIGIGPGKDFDKLSRHFDVVGSDVSQEFLRLYRLRNDRAHLLRLDARTLQTDLTFDAIYSNKALIHLSDTDLQASFDRQHEILNPGGLILHSFWYGDDAQDYGDLTMVNRNEHQLRAMLDHCFEVVEIERHAKMAENDSVYVIARRKD